MHTQLSAQLRPSKRRGVLSLEYLENRCLPAPASPVYQVTFGDAVTGVNAFRGADGQRYWTVSSGADNYQVDTYERPTAQNYQVRRLQDGSQRFAASEYLENLDLVQAKAGYDGQYLYVSLDLFGLNKVTADGSQSYEGLNQQYGFRLSKDSPDGRGGLLLVADQPQFKNSPNTSWGSAGTFGYRDSNRDVGGTGLAVTKQDRSGEVAGNGYESVVIADGRLNGNATVLWTRVSPADPTVVEFAFDYRALGFVGRDLDHLPYLEFEANKGLKSPANYLWNDEYTKSEAGSPYRAATGDRSKSEFGTQGLGNIYELDTVRGGPLGQPASLSGFVYVDCDYDGVVDDGEPGLGGVMITLTGLDDLGNLITRSLMTNPNGFYSFSDLRPGTYSLRETQPPSYADGLDSVGTVGGQVRGTVVENDHLGQIRLNAGEHGINYNFGEVVDVPPDH